MSSLPGSYKQSRHSAILSVLYWRTWNGDSPNLLFTYGLQMPVGIHRVQHIQFPLTSMRLCLQNVLAVAMSGCKLSPITELEEVITGWQKSIVMHNNIIYAIMLLQRTVTRRRGLVIAQLHTLLKLKYKNI